MTIALLIQSLCCVSVLALWMTWGAAVWSHRAHLRRLWATSIVGGMLWIPAEVMLMAMYNGVRLAPRHECGLGGVFMLVMPVFLGLTVMGMWSTGLTIATLIRRHRRH